MIVNNMHLKKGSCFTAKQISDKNDRFWNYILIFVYYYKQTFQKGSLKLLNNKKIPKEGKSIEAWRRRPKYSRNNEKEGNFQSNGNFCWK